MVVANGTSFSPMPERKPALSASTRAFLARHGLDATGVPAYFVDSDERPVDVLRLTNAQVASIPAAERPQTVPERNGLDHLLFLPADA